MSQTYYELLGWPIGIKVEEWWNHEQLRKVALKVSNEIEKSNMTTEEKADTFKCLETVWEILGNPVKRQLYNNALRGMREHGLKAADVRIGGKPLLQTEKQTGLILPGHEGDG